MTTIYKTVAASGGGMEFVLSDNSVDRVGDVIEASGWQLANFKKNPIALFGHSGSFVVGGWSNVRVEGNKLLAKLDLAARGTSDRINELISLVEQGFLRAVSVGFKPVQSEPIDEANPYGGRRYQKQELVEASLVAVPANANALAIAKSLNISDETLSLAFGEHADTRRKDITGGQAVRPHAIKALTMKTLAQRIEDAQNDLTLKKDKLNELTNAETLDVVAGEELNAQIEGDERALAFLKASESKIGISAVRSVPATIVPARRPLSLPQRTHTGLDLIVHALVVRGCSHYGNKTIDRVLEERYPGHEPTEMIVKADQTVGTTTVTGWAKEVVQESWAGFLQALLGVSVYPDLRARGIGLSFDGVGLIHLPSRTAGGAGGGFVAEGSPIRVGRITTAAITMTPFKMGVIVPFTRELAKRSTPAIESLVRQSIVEDTAAILDAALLDASAATTARPAGLLNGVAATATGFAGGDFKAIVTDFKVMLAPFYAANAADNITVMMNPSQGLAMALMPDPMGQFGWASALTQRLHIVESTHVPANRLIAIRNSDFATATGDAPEFDVSEEATIHMEDTTPLEIVSGVPTSADPVRSLWQTASVGVRMLMDVSWKMRRSGMISWIDTTTW